MQGSDVRWDDLPAFLAVARAGTLAAAASRLGVNASTVHRRIAALEEALGTTLFERDPRGYALTGVGEALLPLAEQVEEAVLAAQRGVLGHDRSAVGPVTITLPESLLPIVTPQLVRVRELAPGLRPILRADDRILDLGSDADLALRPSNEPPLTAVGRKVGTIAWCVYGPSTEPDLPWVIYSEGSGPAAASAWRRKHHANVPVLLEVSSVGAMHRVLTCTRALGLLPCYLGDPTPSLERVGSPIPEASADFWLLIHADLKRSARVRAMVDLLLPRLEEMAPLLAGASARPRLP